MTVAIGIYQPRKRGEVEDLRRAVKPYAPDFTFQIGGFRVEDVAGIPHLNYRDLDKFLVDVDREGPVLDIIALELDTHAVPLGRFAHPENVAYLLGPNTGYIPQGVLDKIGRIVAVETPNHEALNTAAVGAILLHDRHVNVTLAQGKVA